VVESWSAGSIRITASLQYSNTPSLRRELKFIWLALCTLLFALCTAAAAQSTKLPKVGWLGARSASAPARELFVRELRALGYVEGKNIVFEYRYAEGRLERLPALVDELIRLKVDILLTAATPAAVAAKKVTRTIPIVFYTGSDPVALGLVDSLARPGENITGFTTIEAVVVGKRLELLKETIPTLSRVAVLWNPEDPISAQSWKESQLPARELGLELHSMEVNSADRFEAAFKVAAKAGSAALALMSSPFFFSHQKQIVDLTAKNRLPAIYAQREFVASGGLMSYGADEAEPYRRAAIFVDKILRGTKPADIPVEQPTKFELVINLKTAKQIGLTIPPNVLARADRVIK
jgi:putative tryptophan/tyrosine transport system substrate-binding protein